jgi:rhodanese-related sulfurtransferase
MRTILQSIATCAALAIAGLSFAQTPSCTGAVADERVIDLPLGGGLTQRVLYAAPARVRAILIMLPGGSGDVGVRRDGDLRHDDNFVVRTRSDWVSRGYAVLIPDTIDGANLRGVRSSPAYAQLVDGLAAYAHRESRAPVFLLGTSQGTIAAMNGAAHASPGLVSGVVLTESVSAPGRHSRETVFDAAPQDVRVPVLVVANRDDACDVAPPSMAPSIAAAMTRSPNARVLVVQGGVQRSGTACGSLSPHGYYGIEQPVVGAIAGWLAAHGG